MLAEMPVALNPSILFSCADVPQEKISRNALNRLSLDFGRKDVRESFIVAPISILSALQG